MKRLAIGIALAVLLSAAPAAAVEVFYARTSDGYCFQTGYYEAQQLGLVYDASCAPSPPATNSYAFLGNRVNRWRPCTTPIRYHIDLSTRVVQYDPGTIYQAIDRMSRQTGYHFQQVPKGQEQLSIRWSYNVGTNAAWASSWMDYEGYRVGGYIEFHPTKYPLYATALHEMGHIMGLGHVENDPAQIMNVPRKATELGGGDKLGLTYLDNDQSCWLA